MTDVRGTRFSLFSTSMKIRSTIIVSEKLLDVKLEAYSITKNEVSLCSVLISNKYMFFSKVFCKNIPEWKHKDVGLTCYMQGMSGLPATCKACRAYLLHVRRTREVSEAE